MRVPNCFIDKHIEIIITYDVRFQASGFISLLTDAILDTQQNFAVKPVDGRRQDKSEFQIYQFEIKIRQHGTRSASTQQRHQGITNLTLRNR